MGLSKIHACNTEFVVKLGKLINFLRNGTNGRLL